MILQVPDHYLVMLEEEAENTMTELQTFLPLLGSVQLMDTDPDQVRNTIDVHFSPSVKLTSVIFFFLLGTRLYREPTSKSNRTIVLNAIEYVVFPGVVNAETRNRVLDVIDRCDCPHFLLLFRDAKCQFRGLYAYYPDTEEVYKIYGTGPKQVTENMYECFFK